MPNDGTVTDNVTGLTWQQTPDNTGLSWQGAVDAMSTRNSNSSSTQGR
jgi:hypothetical protein